MQGNLSDFAARNLPLIEEQLRRQLPESSLQGTERLNEALRYAISSGGKRCRPLLTLITAQAFQAPPGTALQTACAVEYLHLSSVILDDLPAMDDAKMRRHLPALHLAFDEATAILAAMALYARAFETFASFPGIIREAAEAVGCNGMTGGQAADLRGVAGTRLMKTTPLVRLALLAGARAGNAPPEQIAVLGEFGGLVGEAYQLRDDLLDALASEAATGKTGCQDSRHNRRALTPEHGVPAVFGRLESLVECAIQTLRAGFRPCLEAELLCEFAGTLRKQAMVLVHGDDADFSDCGVAGAGGGQRRPLAAGEPHAGKPAVPPVGSDPRA